MSVYSMTGFATGRKASLSDTAAASASNPAQPHLVLEIRSVNSRFLDLSFRLPDSLRQHEPALRALLGKHIRRGKLELRAHIEGSGNAALGKPDPLLLAHLAQVQAQVQAQLHQAAPLSVADVLHLAARDSSGLPLVAAETVQALAQEVLGDFVAARAREGERMADLLKQCLHGLRELADQAEPLVPQAVETQRQRFVERWNEALVQADSQLPTAAVQERALSEAAAFAVRIDVAEELGRLRAHLDEIESVLAQGGAVGKRLDFLIQELHREANTLGSKSAALTLSRISVDMKVLIEQMREQVQNLE